MLVVPRVELGPLGLKPAVLAVNTTPLVAPEHATRPLPPCAWSTAFLATPLTDILRFFQKKVDDFAVRSAVGFLEKKLASVTVLVLNKAPDGRRTPLAVFLEKTFALEEKV